MFRTFCSCGVGALIYNCSRFKPDHKTTLVGLEMFSFISVSSVRADTHVFGVDATSQREVVNDEDEIQTQGLEILCVVFMCSQEDDGP